MAGHDNVKVRLRGMAKIGMASPLVVNVETRAQKGTQ